MKFQALFAALLMGLAAPALAAPDTAKPAETAEDKPAPKPVPDPVMFKSTHTGTFGGQKITYRVEAGETEAVMTAPSNAYTRELLSAAPHAPL